MTNSGKDGVDWLAVRRGEAPLVLSMPHVGTTIPEAIAGRLVSPSIGIRDADHHIPALYAFAEGLGATVVRTDLSRTVIDLNRDPSGASLYPGQATTGLCPTETFDGEPLYRPGEAPDAAEIARRRIEAFEPYHAALAAEIARLREQHANVVVCDCHSIRSVIPRLFPGRLPVFNLGTNDGRSCAPDLRTALAAVLEGSGRNHVVDGRFKGGWITRHYGAPESGVHAVQMEIAMRGYLREPEGAVGPDNWPVAFDPAFAAPTVAVLGRVLAACLAFAAGRT
jgi:formiminoglutamase